MKEVKKNEYNSWRLTGLFDAEGCFSYGLTNNKPYYEIKLTQKAWSEDCLKLVLEEFGVGKISIDNKDTKGLKWLVKSLPNCSKVLEHFEKYPLKTSKYLDYMSFKKALESGRNPEAFTTVKNTSRPVEERVNWNKTTTHEINDGWLVGFIDGEACFNIDKNPLNGTLEIKQKDCERQLLEAIRDQLGVGYLKPKVAKLGKINTYKVSGQNQLWDVIIPMMDKTTLWTAKKTRLSSMKRDNDTKEKQTAPKYRRKRKGNGFNR